MFFFVNVSVTQLIILLFFINVRRSICYHAAIFVSDEVNQHTHSTRAENKLIKFNLNQGFYFTHKFFIVHEPSQFRQIPYALLYFT